MAAILLLFFSLLVLASAMPMVLLRDNQTALSSVPMGPSKNRVKPPSVDHTGSNEVALPTKESLPVPCKRRCGRSDSVRTTSRQGNIALSSASLHPFGKQKNSTPCLSH